MTRTHDLNRAILTKLDGANPYTYPEEQLLEELQTLLSPPVGRAEFDEAMLFLQSRKAVATVPDGLDPDLVRWTITSVGKSLLAQ